MILIAALTVLCPLLPAQSGPDVENGWAAFQSSARQEHGELGERAAEFLFKHHPESDDSLGADLLMDNLRLALAARERFPWAASVPEELFLNDVLPYAVLDETRESWRPLLTELVTPLVADCKTLEDAAQTINQRLFNVIAVHYNKGRKRPNACPSESIEQGRATCTGLTILFVDACRAAGIPARAAGVFEWNGRPGNHTWAEFWDGERWRFTGADEFDAKGPDRAWFTADAAKAIEGNVEHAVWATSWKRGAAHFPLAWAKDSTSVAAVDVTERYRSKDADAALEVLGGDGEGLGEEASHRVASEEWDSLKAALAAELAAEDEARAFKHEAHTLRIKEKMFGSAKEGERSLWISMHGGGSAPPGVNDGQWENQIRLYAPEEGFYVAPRAPTDTWNLWHQGHIDPLFERMIASYVTRHGVDPNRVFLMGYSAGGDGVYQLAPRMADRFAAAAMMAGHPNETQPAGLRNLPFMIFMGGKDGDFDRNKVAAQWKEKLAALREDDPEGYEHEVTIYPDKGHWMDNEDRSALPWMAAKTRKPWPKRIVWRQDDVTHERFYWLGSASPKAGTEITATASGQQIQVESKDADSVVLWLRDDLIDLDKDIEVLFNGHSAFSGRVERTRAAIKSSLASVPDPKMTATARLEIQRPEK